VADGRPGPPLSGLPRHHAQPVLLRLVRRMVGELMPAKKKIVPIKGGPVNIYVNGPTRYKLDEISRTSKLPRSALLRIFVNAAHRDPSLVGRLVTEEMEKSS
jgi:hypothetical protein